MDEKKKKKYFGKKFKTRTHLKKTPNTRESVVDVHK